MGVHFRVPGDPLSNFVELFWLFDRYAVPHAREQLLPGATTELVIDLRPAAQGSGSALVAGPHSEHSVLDTSEELSLLGVHFKSGGGFPFFGVPAGELHNLQVPLDVLWGARAAELRERVLAAPTADAKFSTPAWIHKQKAYLAWWAHHLKGVDLRQADLQRNIERPVKSFAKSIRRSRPIDPPTR